MCTGIFNSEGLLRNVNKNKGAQLHWMAVLVFIILGSGNSLSQQSWVQVPSPDASATRNLLNGISGTSSSDVWVVGEFESSSGNLQNLIMHWNGGGWQFFPDTDLGDSYNDLWDVTAITSDDVWAAGAWNEPGTTRSQLIQWNGSEWSHTILPDIQGGSFLFGIDAISSNDIWAVGGQAGSPTDPTYTIHYDGSNWTEIAAENPGTYRNWFNDVDGVSSDDVWAVGRLSDSYGDFHAMAQHWDGNEWTNSELPASVSSPLGDLESITMISANDVWALGSTVMGYLIMIHWDGVTWSEVATEGGTGGYVIARESEVYGVGDRISEWDGNSWTVIDSLNFLSYPSLVSAVTFSNGDIWAAGRTYDTAFHTLVYRTDSSPLSIRLEDYSVSKSGSTATMHWLTASESSTQEFVMERSTDRNDFMPISKIQAQGIGYSYELIDPAPIPGWNYYRLKELDIDGRITHYPIKSLFFADGEIEPFTVYPNPVYGSELSLRLNVKEECKLGLFDVRGQEVMMRNVNGSVSTISLNLPNNLHPGVYTLSLMEGENKWSKLIFVPE